MNRLSIANSVFLPPGSGIKPAKTINLEQLRKDEEKQQAISNSQRRYMKCSNGKCVKQLSEFEEKLRKKMAEKKTNFVSKSLQDKKLKRIFVEIGRKKRIEWLEKENRELSLKINAAQGKLYVKENEENFRKIAQHLEIQTELAKEIEKAKKEISHIKSQFTRLDKKMADLKQQTESESE